MNYYNDNDPHVCQWVRQLIRNGLVPDGEVDGRSILDVRPEDLAGFTQCHFFCGILGWPHALDLAGWPEDRPVWTGSAPCQPYSVASVAHGGAKGHRDSRDLWPHFSGLIRECHPSVVFGEQVASALGWGWWDRAALDLEAQAYSTGAAVLRADAFGASHERKRLYWVALAGSKGRAGHQQVQCVFKPAAAALSQHGNPLARAGRALDGDYSGLLPSDGLSVVMERSALAGYGNAIVPQCAAEFISAFLDTELTP